MSGKINRRGKKAKKKAARREKPAEVPIVKEPEPPPEVVREPESYDTPTPEAPVPESPAPAERSFLGKVGDFLGGK